MRFGLHLKSTSIYQRNVSAVLAVAFVSGFHRDEDREAGETGIKSLVHTFDNFYQYILMSLFSKMLVSIQRTRRCLLSLFHL